MFGARGFPTRTATPGVTGTFTKHRRQRSQDVNVLEPRSIVSPGSVWGGRRRLVGSDPRSRHLLRRHPQHALDEPPHRMSSTDFAGSGPDLLEPVLSALQLRRRQGGPHQLRVLLDEPAAQQLDHHVRRDSPSLALPRREQGVRRGRASRLLLQPRGRDLARGVLPWCPIRVTVRPHVSLGHVPPPRGLLGRHRPAYRRGPERSTAGEGERAGTGTGEAGPGASRTAPARAEAPGRPAGSLRAPPAGRRRSRTRR